MKRYETFIIGHISKDIIISHEGETSKSVGGAVIYSSHSAHALGHATGVLTKIAPEDKDLLEHFSIPSEDIYTAPSSTTTSIENRFLSADKERRTCIALSIGKPFGVQDIPEVESEIYHLAGLIKGDFEPELLPYLAKKGKLAVDMQGFLRVAEEGDMVFYDWDVKKEYLPYIHFLKTDAAEAEIMTGCADREEAAKILMSWGAKEVMITHNTEVLLLSENGLFRWPLIPRNLSGRTGRGDTCFSAYITERLHTDENQALLYAAATVSRKMESPGPFKGTKEEITQYIKEFYSSK